MQAILDSSYNIVPYTLQHDDLPPLKAWKAPSLVSQWALKDHLGCLVCCFR